MIKKILGLYRRTFWNKVKYARYLGVKVGNNCLICTDKFGSEPYLIEIGDHVFITDGVRFFTHGGAALLRQKYPQFDCFGKIKLGNNVYIGSNALILPGVTIGNNVVIAAGSIVTKSIPDNSVIAGTPAKIVSNIETFFDNLIPFNVNTFGMSPEQKKEVLLSLPDDKFIRK